MLVDSEASGHYFDELHPGLKDKLQNYKPLERLHEIVTAARHVLLGTATGTVSGKATDTEGNKHQVNVEGLIRLEHHLFSTSQTAKVGITTIIDSRPRLDRNHHVLPLHQLNINSELLSFDLEIAEAT